MNTEFLIDKFINLVGDCFVLAENLVTDVQYGSILTAGNLVKCGCTKLEFNGTPI